MDVIGMLIGSVLDELLDTNAEDEMVGTGDETEGKTAILVMTRIVLVSVVTVLASVSTTTDVKISWVHVKGRS